MCLYLTANYKKQTQTTLKLKCYSMIEETKIILRSFFDHLHSLKMF